MELLYDRCLLMALLRDRACPSHYYTHTVSSLATSFSSTQVLGTIFLFSTLFSIFSSVFPVCWMLPSQKGTSMMHVLQTLLYFRINWYWFSPEIRHWLNFNSISFAPTSPKAQGHRAPAWATQDTPRVWQNSLGSCYPFPNFSLSSKGKNQEGKSVGCLLAFVPIAKLWKLQHFVFSRKVSPSLSEGTAFPHCFSYPNQAVRNNSHPNKLHGIDLGRPCSLDSHLPSSPH